MKHETWRHDSAAYGSTQPVAARFADVDTRRHVTLRCNSSTGLPGDTPCP